MSFIPTLHNSVKIEKLTCYVDDLACVAMKGVVSCDNLEVGAYFL